MKRAITGVWLLCAFLAHPQAHAELSERVALERGMTQPHLQHLLKARLDQAEGERDAAGRWDNPEIEYSQENLDLLTGRSEETTWWLRQRLNIAGSKGLAREAATMALRAAEAAAELERRQWRTRIREQFYAAVAAQTQAEVLNDHRRRLQRIAAMIEQRVAQGDASRYDNLRMAQELARAEAAFAESKAGQQAARQRLFSLVGGAPDALTGALLPQAVKFENRDLDQALEQHPQLQMLGALEQSASLSAQAARREAWPEVSVGVGRKTLDEGGYSAEGNAVSLSIEMPLFDRNRGEVRTAQNRAHEYAADYALTRRQLHSQLQALQTTLTAQRESAQALREAVTSGEDSLSTIAEASYQAGELGIMELLDAYRTELDTWLQYIDSARAARTTFIHLQQLEGQ